MPKKNKNPIWHLVQLKPETGDVADIYYTYYNRGHAVSRLKRLMRISINSEVTWAIRKG